MIISSFYKEGGGGGRKKRHFNCSLQAIFDVSSLIRILQGDVMGYCCCCCQTPPPTHNGTCILSLYSLPYLSSHLRFLLLLIVFVFLFFNATHAASNGGRASQSNLLPTMSFFILLSLSQLVFTSFACSSSNSFHPSFLCSAERPLIYLFYNLTAIAIIIAAVNARPCFLLIN